MSATQQTLAQLIRSKYPDAYNDMSDTDLENNVLAKHPEYSDLPRTAAPPNPRTGEGMEAYAQRQAAHVPLDVMDKAAQAHAEQQAKLGAAMNRASRSPTPFTNASTIFAPMAAAKSIIGAKLGSAVGEKLDPQDKYKGSLIGGTVGGFGGGMVGEDLGAIKNKAASTLRKPATPAQSMRGEPGAVKDFLPPFMQKWTVPPWLIPKGEVGTPTNPGPFAAIPAKAPATAASITPPPTGATLSNAPVGSAQLPPAPETPQQPFPTVTRQRLATTPKPKVAAPWMKAGESEGRPATWTNETVQKLAPWQDPDAVAQMQKRMIGPGGEGSVPAKFSTVELKPKYKATFDAQGNIVDENGVPKGNPTPWYKPSEKATTMSADRPSLGPEWEAGERTHELERNKAILRDPNATQEERAVAQSRLSEQQSAIPGLVDKGEVIKGSGIRQFELASQPGKTVAVTPKKIQELGSPEAIRSYVEQEVAKKSTALNLNQLKAEEGIGGPPWDKSVE